MGWSRWTRITSVFLRIFRFGSVAWWFQVEDMGIPFLEVSIFLYRISLPFVASNYFLHELDWSLDFTWDFALPSRHGHCTCEVSLYIRKYFNSTSQTLPMFPLTAAPESCGIVMSTRNSSNFVLADSIHDISSTFHVVTESEEELECKGKPWKVETGCPQPGTATNNMCLIFRASSIPYQPLPEQKQILAKGSKRTSEHQQQHCMHKRTTHDKKGRTTSFFNASPNPNKKEALQKCPHGQWRQRIIRRAASSEYATTAAALSASASSSSSSWCKHFFFQRPGPTQTLKYQVTRYRSHPNTYLLSKGNAKSEIPAFLMSIFKFHWLLWLGPSPIRPRWKRMPPDLAVQGQPNLYNIGKHRKHHEGSLIGQM